MSAESSTPQLPRARALVLSGRCPACAERLPPRSLFRLAPCPRCESPIDPNLTGTRLAEALESRGRRRLLAIALAVGAAHLFLGWVPMVGALVLLAAAAWIRLGILQPSSELLSPKRRVLTRWSARLVMAVALTLTVIATEALTLVPVIGLPVKAVISAGEVALAAWAVTSYVHWQVRREAAGKAIAVGEWLVLGLAGGALLAALVFLVVAFAALASAFDWLLGWLK